MSLRGSTRTNLRESNYDIDLTAGEYLERFELTFSMQFVVLSDLPNSADNPNLWSVNVSSKPSVNELAADLFILVNSFPISINFAFAFS